MQSTSLADLPMGKLTELIASNSVTPGAGAAGALALSLAAACGAKAVSISLKHSSDPRLHRASDRLRELCRCALREANEDAEAFAAWVRDRGSDTTDELIESEERMAHLINTLLLTISEVEPCIMPNMVGDLSAARALARAAREIQIGNETETKASSR